MSLWNDYANVYKILRFLTSFYGFFVVLGKDVYLFPELDSEELVEHGSVKPFHKANRFRRENFSSPVFNVIYFQVDLIGMILGPTIFASIISEYIPDLDFMLFVKGKNIVAGIQ